MLAAMKSRIPRLVVTAATITLIAMPTAAAAKTTLAPEPGPSVRSLGLRLDPGGAGLVQGFAITHYRKAQGPAKPSGVGGGKTQCYGYLASGAKWRTVEPWLVNPANAAGLDAAAIYTELAAGVDKWEDAADGTIGNGSGLDIFAAGSSTSEPLSLDTSAPDDRNEVVFGPLNDGSAIAVTNVWGIFSGPASGRKLVEWDQLYDDVDYAWSSTGATGAMDFANIATHELGHSFGLGDLYNSACGEETMYGYATEGETKKRDLNPGDVKGISALY